jgi:hypothetical protein
MLRVRLRRVLRLRRSIANGPQSDWHGCKDSNPDRTVLETGILPLNYTRSWHWLADSNRAHRLHKPTPSPDRPSQRKHWSRWLATSQRPSAYETDALTTELHRDYLAPPHGFEPRPTRSKRAILPLDEGGSSMIPKSGYRFSEKDHALTISKRGMTNRRKSSRSNGAP